VAGFPAEATSHYHAPGEPRGSDRSVAGGAPGRRSSGHQFQSL